MAKTFDLVEDEYNLRVNFPSGSGPFTAKISITCGEEVLYEKEFSSLQLIKTNLTGIIEGNIKKTSIRLTGRNLINIDEQATFSECTTSGSAVLTVDSPAASEITLTKAEFPVGLIVLLIFVCLVIVLFLTWFIIDCARTFR